MLKPKARQLWKTVLQQKQHCTGSSQCLQCSLHHSKAWALSDQPSPVKVSK